MSSFREYFENDRTLSDDEKEGIRLQVQIMGQILQVRKDKNLTQAQLEQLSGIKQTFIARIERHRTDPQINTVLKLLRPLGMTLAVVPIKRDEKYK